MLFVLTYCVITFKVFMCCLFSNEIVMECVALSGLLALGFCLF